MNRWGGGILSLAVGASLLSFSPVFVKVAHAGPTAVAFWRMAVGGVILAVIVLVRRERLWNGWRTFLGAAACGLLFALDLTLWHKSIRYVGPGLATILASFQVLFVSAFSFLVLKERLGWRFILAIPAALVGMYLLVGVSWGTLSRDYRWGILWGLASALTYAAYILLLRRTQGSKRALAPRVSLAVVSLVSAAALAVEVAALGAGGEDFAIADFGTGAALVGYGVCGQVLGWVLIARGIARVNASKVALILLLQPALAFIWDVLFFGRPTKTAELLGAIIALGAIYLGAGSGRGGRAGESTPIA